MATWKKPITEAKKRNMAFKVFADANLPLDFTLQRANYIPSRDVVQHGINVTEAFVKPGY